MKEDFYYIRQKIDWVHCVVTANKFIKTNRPSKNHVYRNLNEQLIKKNPPT